MHRDGELNSGKPSKIRFNIMAVGEIGSGKTAFLKTLFKAYCASDRVRNELYTKAVKTVKIEEFGCFVLVDTEYEVHIFDSPGYGDCMNNQYSIEALKNYLENAHKAWLETNCNQMTEEVCQYKSIYF